MAAAKGQPAVKGTLQAAEVPPIPQASWKPDGDGSSVGTVAQ